MADAEKLSLYQTIAKGGYEASILATYAISFPLYERVLLRRLQAAGSRHNVLLADGGQCAKAFETEQTRPEFAGQDYLLLPIRSESSFHPKFVLLLGKRGATLVVGSHNITIAGFGLNREIGTTFDCATEGPTAELVRGVWRFVKAWSTGFPDRIRDVLLATERVAPWLNANEAAASPPVLIHSEPSGPSLWEQVRPLLGQGVRRVSVVSPYFDAKLSFINSMLKELRPKECLIAVHPTFSVVPPNAKAFSPSVRFVDIAKLGEKWAKQCLHAKLYRFDLANGKAVVVSGSANASERGWTSVGGRRNAELVAVHQDADGLWKRLGLSTLGSLKDVDSKGWAEIKARGVRERESTRTATPFVAIETASGFFVPSAFAAGAKAGAIKAFGDSEIPSAIEAIRTERDGVLCVCSDSAVRAAAIVLEIAPAGGPKRVAIVHHVETLLDRAAGNVRQAFRAAMAGLPGDPEQLSNLLKVVEKAIFDGHVPVEGAESIGGRRASATSEPKAAAEPISLEIAAKDTSHARRRRRLSASSDLAVIIDALIYRLGLGLAKPEIDTPDSVTPKERSEDDDSDPPEIDGHVLAKACRGKVNRLFRRMLDQLELAGKRGDDATTAIVQLAAVLGVVKHLRTCQASVQWLPKYEELVDLDHAWDFFKEASRFLYAPQMNLSSKAKAENDGQEFDELTAVRGLLAWLAFDCDLDSRNALKDLAEEPEVAHDNLVGLAYLIPVIGECVTDAPAEALLLEAAGQRGAKTQETATFHLGWSRRVADGFRRVPQPTTDLRLGDVVRPVKMQTAWPSVVMDVQYGKAGVVDLDTGEAKNFGEGYLARVQRL